jgi:hypothetical protein
MIKTGFETRVKVQQIIENQLPEFLRSESPKAVDFLKQYYISQEYQGAPADLANNLDQYLKIDNLTPEVITGTTTLSSNITASGDTVQVNSTKGFPAQYGLFQIDNEIFTYTGITTNSFTGCVRGFSGITSYRSELNPEELVFKETDQAAHTSGATVKNLSSEFLKEFYKKLKYTFTPGLEDVDFVSNLNVNNFIKEARSLYESKGTEESFKILFRVLYGVTPTVIDLEDRLLKPSSSQFLRREVIVVERISGDPSKLIGQTIRKSSDSETQASVSEVEVFTRGGTVTYFKLGLFVGYDDRDLIEGTFNIQPKTKAINAVSVGASSIIVDTTIGFPASGTLISGDNTITYTSKTVNQFLGCSGINSAISVADEIRTNEVFIGYEDGDITKKVELRITGVLSKFETVSDIKLSTEGQKIYVKNVGEKITNPESDKTYKQLFANSWIYNTSSRYQVDSISGSNFVLKSDIDKSSLKVGDTVDILLGSTENVDHPDATVASISGNQVTLDNLIGFTYDSTLEYSIRRKLRTANSTGTPVLYSNDAIVSDVQNLYNENDEYFYVASNSLPSYEITKTIKKSTISSANSTTLKGYNSTTEKYSIISFTDSVPFITGDEVYYSASSTALTGMPEGNYYVKVLSPDNQIKLYLSRSLIVTDNPVEFTSSSSTGSHTFVLASQKDEVIKPQKVLKKFPFEKNIKLGKNEATISGSTGMLVNGVEIINYKSEDKIYYGPLDKITLYNSGSGYDVINPPDVVVSAGSGTTALVRPTLKGSLKEVIVDPQDFDIKKITSVTLTGGNGSGAILEPVLEKRFREVEFDSRVSTDGGGIDITADTLTFSTQHKFSDGDAIVYNRNGNNAVGVGTFGGSNADTGTVLNSGSVYYTQVVNSTTVKLYPTLTDYNAGINTVGFTTSNTQGIHKFRTLEGKNTLRSIKVINPGSGYENKKLIIKPENVSTVEDNIFFENHGFADGDIVNYTTTGTVITGLSTTLSYYIIKQSDDRFRLASAGVGATITSNYVSGDYVNITGTGTGYHNFRYPDIQLNISAEYDGVSGIITATPIVTGEITNLYLYEKGTGYGSNVLNFHKKPSITIKTGKEVELKAIVSGGKVSSVQVTNSGSEYTSAPELTVNGAGVGAKLRAVVTNGEVTQVVVINGGIGYDANTTISATSRGLNAFAEATVRELSINNEVRFGSEVLLDNPKNLQGLEYGVVGYTTSIGNQFSDTGSQHSPIIGWAYDGNPIYGSYGYSDATDANSSVKVLVSGYTKSTSNVTDRPSGFASGFFVEDYKFDNSGDLDQYNGRYCKTPEFPNGVYAYFATISSTTFESTFPYFVGNSYKSLFVSQNVNQDFDFNSSSLVRNTFPYKVGDRYSDNDFISESNEILVQRANIDSVTKGEVNKLTVNLAGSGYAVGDVASFDNTGTSGGGLSADVKSIKGKTVTNLNTTVNTYQDAKVIWEDSNSVSLHIDKVNVVGDGNSVIVSGLSTFVAGLTKSHIVGVTSEKTYLIKQVPTNATAGVVTDIYFSRIPVSLSIGSTVAIGTEKMSVLNIFPENKVVRALRGVTGTAHTASTEASVLTGKLSLSVKTSYFDSKLNDKVYFNPSQSVGVGATTGISVSKSYEIGDITKTISVPTQSIYLPNHPFKTSQPVVFEKLSGANAVSASNTESSGTFNIPSGNSQTLYVINKSKDYIGLTTEVGLTTSTDGLYFRSFTANGDDTDYQYSLESNFTQVTTKVEKVESTITLSESHSLAVNDSVTLTVKPNQSVGIGTSTAIIVKYNSANNKLLINPIGFTSTGVSTTTNELTISSHGLLTGDKVFYDSSDEVISGLETGSYYVYRIDDDTINLSSTYYNALSSPPSVVSFASTGGAGHEISKINPQIKNIRNNNLVFDVTDSSLSGYNFKLFEDKDFYNELVSVGSSTTFNVIGVGTVGVSTNASVTLNYGATLPTKVYYALEKSGYISTSDKNVANSSEILFVDSDYNGTYAVTGIGSTTFTISLRKNPERLSYTQSNTEVLKYSTTSTNEKGGVDSMRITSKGLNYKKLPKFVSIASSTGESADIIPESANIGRINEVTIEDQGFDFSADKTLSPEAFVSPIVNLVDRNTITDVSVSFGGAKYTSAPDLVVVNPLTGLAYDNGILEAKMQGSSIAEVEVVEVPRGLSDTVNKVYALNNSNGVAISTCSSSTSGILTCTLVTPISGFSTDAFSVGDKVFLENIRKFGTSGDGFNSADHEYRFFNVTAYTNSNPAKVTVDISPYTTNAGVAVTAQNSYATIIKQSDYPTFTVTQETLNFIVGEKIFTLDGSTYVERDLVVTENLSDSIKVYGTYELSASEVILGRDSGTIATIESLDNNRAFFRLDYSLRKDMGWSDDIGKTNLDYQVTPDNDYYQNLSYSIKSPIEYEDLVNPVNRLLHTSGLKNFADTEVSSKSTVAAGTSISSSSLALLDIISEERVDTIKNYDLAIDIDTQSFSPTKSKFLKLQNKKLSDYIECVSNRVLPIDNINTQFSSNQGETELYSDIVDYSINDGYNRFLVQIVNPDNDERQTTEVITLPSPSGDIVTVEKGSVYSTTNEVGELTGFINDSDELSLRFIPDEKFESDYDIKVLKNNFSSGLAGIGSQSIGFINLTGRNISVGSATTETIFSADTGATKAFFINAEVENRTTDEINYVELYVSHNDTDTYVSEYYFDNDSNKEITGRFIGSFSSNINSGVISINYNNTDSNDVFVRTRIVGFGTTASGIGTYRFKSSGQPDGSENTARLESAFINASGISTILSVSKSDVTSIKTIARIGYGNTTSLHQLLTIHDDTDTYITQYPFLSDDSVTGIGTFGSEISGSNVIVKFYPDASVTDTVNIQTYSEIIQTERDLINIPLDLTYGTISESIIVSAYNGRNGNRVNKLDFDLNTSGTPIFQKTFNPSDTDILNLGTGVFTIKDHFFSTGEELNYASASSFSGQSFSDIQVSGASSLPSEVYAIRVNSDQFKLATSRANATTGTAVTFSSSGSGNAHTLEMSKRMEKSIILIDGVVQSPIAFTPNTCTLFNNGGSIGAGNTYFAVSGISSILPGDLLKIDDEYVKVDSVGLGTTAVGPITGTGSFNVVKTVRGFVGSSATTHTDGSTARVYLGSFNIVNNKAYFTEPPQGNSTDAVDLSNIPTPRSTFSGRVYLRDDYSTNQIFDNISKSFTGINSSYTLTVGGANTTGIETGSGVLFINDIFQTPTTENNVGNNYDFSESAGVSTVRFTGITTSGGLLISDYDVNSNQLPRGGIIVSLGSTPGLGYAPLVGASVTAVVGAGGSIVSVGLGTTDITGSGYNSIVSIGVSVFESGHTGDVATITATVGVGGTLSFSVGAGGTGYSNPSILVTEPSYENLSVTGVSRLGFGATTDTGTGLLMSVDVGASSRTGIGSTLFEVSSFKITRPGYGFRVGDVFAPVGLVTDVNLSSPVEQFEVTVLDIFTDSFSAWQFGELDFIDPIDTLQDGARTRFPLYYNGSLLSFEIDENDEESSKIDLSYVLLIFVNGVIQEPGTNYVFEGGTSFIFTAAPEDGDDVDIFFYRGTRNTDTVSVNVNETIKVGDTLTVKKSDTVGFTTTQTDRNVFAITASDKVETDIYSGLGIDEQNYKPFDWTKQKVDMSINGELIYKSRDSIEAQVYPTARIIGDLSTTDAEIFVDDAQFFNYEENESSIVISDVDALIVSSNDPVAAAITAVVSAAGTISSLSIVDGGSGYTDSTVTLSIAAPKSVGVGVGTTATATGSVTAGIITTVSVTNPGFGYTTSNPPLVLAPTPNVSYENILEIDTVEGFSGIVTGISTTSGTAGNPLAIQFFLNSSSFTGLTTGYPIHIFGTGVGSGVTSIDDSNSAVVGVGTTFCDNIYIIHTFNNPGGSNADIIVNVDSGTDVTGLSTTGSTTLPVGRFSWGRLSGFTRADSPISIGVTGLTIDSGLSTFPTIQRRGYGLRDGGSLRKDLG